ncbi:MAG: hypothetical protein IJQ97_02175, partial [Paludibacteraceae bacterium]|nr:hypothetical protein [Paludibacteraceae bacterium]
SDLDMYKYQARILEDSCLLLNDRCRYINREKDSLHHTVDSLKEVINSNTPLGIFKAWPRIVELSSSGESKFIYVNRASDWSFRTEKGNDIFRFTKEAGKNRIAVTANPNLSTQDRESWCYIEAEGENNPIRIRIIQKGANDTIQLINPVTVQCGVESKEGKGLLIKCPFRANYLDGKLTARVYFYQNGEPINAAEKDKKYLYRDETGEPFVCSQEISFTCHATGSSFTDCSIRMPYSKMNNHSGDMTCVVIFKFNKNEIYRTSHTAFTIL